MPDPFLLLHGVARSGGFFHPAKQEEVLVGRRRRLRNERSVYLTAVSWMSQSARGCGEVPEADADGVRVAFGPAVAGDPFAKTLLLAAALSATAAG